MATSARSRHPVRRSPDLEKLVVAALEDMKAVNIKRLDVRGLTDVADAMIVASGNSDRHVRAIAEHVVDKARAAGRRPFGVEGKRDSEWVLVDLQDVLVHVMLPRVREFYALEQLWEAPATRAAVSAGAKKVPARSAVAKSASTKKAAAKRRAAPATGTAPKKSAARSRRGARPRI